MNKLLYAAVGLPHPIKGLQDSIDALNDKLNSIAYWANPINWFKEAGAALYHAVNSGSLDIPLLIFTIAAIWLIMLGAQKPKKLLFWTWIVFWVLRGVLLV